jgi:hypothetical protein
LTRLIDVQINAVRRELNLLLKSELVREVDTPGHIDTSEAGANLRKYYRLDSGSILYPEMQALLIKAQSMGQEKFVKDLEAKSGDAKLIVLSGIFTNDPAAATDILLVGNIKQAAAARLIKKYEKDFGCVIRYTTMSLDEFYDRRHMMDKFLYSIFETKHRRAVDMLEE